MTIEHGSLVCLLGPSGCGKTTTLRLIAGFVEPTEGEILVGDHVVSTPQRTLPPERRNMSMIFQSYALWPHMTVAENIVYGLKLRKLDAAIIRRKLDDILSTTRLGELAARYPGELSGGQQQRVAAARALVTEPALILADEPTGNLDSASTAEVLALFDDLHRSGRTIILITHEHDVAVHAERTVLIRDGAVVDAADVPGGVELVGEHR
jgi:iron(III) transport system ATP-binding protein